jgi:hypothetical protein
MKWTKLFLSRCGTVLGSIIQTKPSCLAKRLKIDNGRIGAHLMHTPNQVHPTLQNIKKVLPLTLCLISYPNKSYNHLNQWIIVMFLLSRFSHKFAIQLGSG